MSYKIYKNTIPKIQELLEINNLKKIVLCGSMVSPESYLVKAGLRELIKNSNAHYDPCTEINFLLSELGQLTELEKLSIVGYFSDMLFLSNLPAKLKKLKLSVYPSYENLINCSNLPSSLNELVIETNGADLFETNANIVQWIPSEPITTEIIVVKINENSEKSTKDYYAGNTLLFDIKIPKLPIGCNVKIANPFQLSSKYNSIV